MNNSTENKELQETSQALQKLIDNLAANKVSTILKDNESWRQVAYDIYMYITSEISDYEYTVDSFKEDKLTFSTIEGEGYIRGLMYVRDRLLEEMKCANLSFSEND